MQPFLLYRWLLGSTLWKLRHNYWLLFSAILISVSGTWASWVDSVIIHKSVHGHAAHHYVHDVKPTSHILDHHVVMGAEQLLHSLDNASYPTSETYKCSHQCDEFSVLTIATIQVSSLLPLMLMLTSRQQLSIPLLDSITYPPPDHPPRPFSSSLV